MNLEYGFKDFVDFCLSAGTARVTLVKRVKVGRRTDPCRSLRNAIAGGADLTEFAKAHPKIVGGYQRFVRDVGGRWFEPPFRAYPLGPITVNVGIDLGLFVNGAPHALAWHVAGEPPSMQRVMLAVELLHHAFAATWPGVTFAMLDVRRSRLYHHAPKHEVAALLRAEAACFASLWHALP